MTVVYPSENKHYESLYTKAQELLEENQAGISFTIKDLEITGTGKNDLDFDSTVYADGTPRQ